MFIFYNPNLINLYFSYKKPHSVKLCGLSALNKKPHSVYLCGSTCILNLAIIDTNLVCIYESFIYHKRKLNYNS
ncbi:hypothetical protein CJD_A0736 [Clostridium perfringens D str. JGS1721]|uniref:Uncharacterized protein n=1 Tax=Clostridium perfringens D str. JGS1721 TaxID=488537 RepID=B1V2Y9_CLOPF|nr:hypothetical protein CJD_A0736 [Clostridium perfringens D str. JGS1721]